MNLQELKEVVEKAANEPHGSFEYFLRFNKTFNPSLVSKLLRVAELSQNIVKVVPASAEHLEAEIELAEALRELEADKSASDMEQS